MIPQTKCPCCGHIVEEAAELHWNEHTRILTGRGHSVALRPMQGKIFTKLWKAWPMGRMIDRNEMMDSIYAGHSDGGVESTNIVSVQINDMRKRIAPFGISVHGRHGYMIYNVPLLAGPLPRAALGVAPNSPVPQEESAHERAASVGT